jgi:hypothetical protein
MRVRQWTSKGPTLLVALAIVLAAGCSADSTASTTQAAPTTLPPTTTTVAATTTSRATTTSQATSTTAATTSTSAPVAYGPTVLVAGQEDCLIADDAHATWTTDDDGTTHIRDGWYTCTVTSDDPRVAGNARTTWNADRWGTSETNGAMVQWGTQRIENGGGVWDSYYVGVHTGPTACALFRLYTGTGDYEGLSYYQWSYETSGTIRPTQGFIFPGTVPTPPDTAMTDAMEATTTTQATSTTAATTSTSAPVAYGPTVLVEGEEDCDLAYPAHGTWTTDADGATHVREGWFTCTVTNNDPRVAGTSLYTWNADRWGTSETNGSMVQWGAQRIENSGGAWESTYVGIYTSETGDVVFRLFTGTGDYAGLSYFMWTAAFGTTWATQGLIFPSTIPTP